MQLYPIAVRSRQHLLDLDIRQSFRQFPDVFIQIHSMEDCAVTAFRRTALTRAQYIAVAEAAAKRVGSTLPLSALSQTLEYRETLDKACPPQLTVLSGAEAETVMKLFHAVLPETDRGFDGLDGHMFSLRLFCDHPQQMEFWCCAAPELALAAEVINLLVQRAGLDVRYYGLKIEAAE